MFVGLWNSLKLTLSSAVKMTLFRDLCARVGIDDSILRASLMVASRVFND